MAPVQCLKKPVGKENNYRAFTWRGEGMRSTFGDQTRDWGLDREDVREKVEHRVPYRRMNMVEERCVRSV